MKLRRFQLLVAATGPYFSQIMQDYLFVGHIFFNLVRYVASSTAGVLIISQSRSPFARHGIKGHGTTPKLPIPAAFSAKHLIVLFVCTGGKVAN
jgi:hypothetical protein